MNRPDQWPNVPYAAFIDNVGPAIVEAFLNPLQQGLQDIAGGLYQRSATILSDDFSELTYTTNKFGLLDIIAATNATLTPAPPLGIAQHGLWHVRATATANFIFLALDAESWLGTFDFTFSGKVRIDAKAELDTASTPGFAIGLRDQVIPSRAYFAAGSDGANWILYLDLVAYDTGVPVVDGTFYELQLCRINETAYAFIDGVLVVTASYPTDLQNLRRIISITAPMATAGNGFYVDYHRVWYQR
jgi:hypothetical protein